MDDQRRSDTDDDLDFLNSTQPLRPSDFRQREEAERTEAAPEGPPAGDEETAAESERAAAPKEAAEGDEAPVPQETTEATRAAARRSEGDPQSPRGLDLSHAEALGTGPSGFDGDSTVAITVGSSQPARGAEASAADSEGAREGEPAEDSPQELPLQPAPISPPPPLAPPPSAGAARAGNRRRGILKWGLPAGIALLLGAGLGIAVAAAIDMPRVDTLSDFVPSRVTRLYASDGESYASYAKQRRVLLRHDQIPERLRNALIATEDRRFYQHGGLDAWGALRAALINIKEGPMSEGASTLTMQLARKLFLTDEKAWRRKIEESFLAVELEKNYSKDQILTLYLNFIYFGHSQYGIEAAARYFFDKSVNELDLAETATLVGIPWNPNRLSPYRRPEEVVARRNTVLRRMLSEGYIDQAEFDAAMAAPLQPAVRAPKDPVGPYFAEEVRRHLETTYGKDALLERGLQVETTLDPAIQSAAERALRDRLLELDHAKGWRGPIRKEEGDLETMTLSSWSRAGITLDRWHEGIVLESNRDGALVRIEGESFTLGPEGIVWTRQKRPDKLLERGDVAWFRLEGAAEGEEGEPVLHLEQEPKIQGAVIALESATGAVRAMVGGWSFASSQFNRATQAKRQPGSAFKLFVYGAAMEAGFTAADTLFDGPVYFAGADNQLTYSPNNHSRKYYGIITLRRALERSMNVTAVKLQQLVGADRAIDFAKRAGITADLQPYPSLALGAADVVPMEMAAAYAAIANQGTWVEPYLIESVKTPEGEVLEQRIAKTATVTSPEVAYVLTHMLEGVVDRGTGRAARSLDVDLAGKTGTTNDYSDAWFVGFTPRYTLLTWVGYDVSRSLGSGMDGSRVALPIWQRILEEGLEEGWIEAGQRFSPPAGVTLAPVEYRTGLLAAAGATDLTQEAFVAGTEPIREFSPEWDQIIQLPWYQQSPFYVPKQGESMPEDFRDLERERAAQRQARRGG